jgi:hypothetical protein
MRHSRELGLSLAFYVISFGLPILRIEPGQTELGYRSETTIFGFGAFLQAAVLVGLTPLVGVWGVVGLLTWSANVCFWIAGFAWASGRFRRACWLGVASVGLGLLGLPLFWLEDHFDRGRWGLLGYWAWLGSFAFLALGAARAAANQSGGKPLPGSTP